MSELLESKIKRLELLRRGVYNPDPQISGLQLEKIHVDRRWRGLNRALSWSAATWAVRQALALGCTAIVLEDLSSLEARGLGRKINVRVSNQVRGLVAEAVRHQAAKAGLAVLLVDARGTSAVCPRCCRALRHVKSPDRLIGGYGWAVCSHCRLSLDRDHAASMRIVGRGLYSQPSAYRDRKTGVVRSCRVDGAVAIARRPRDRRRPSRCIVRSTRPLRPRSLPPKRSVGAVLQDGGLVVAVQAGVGKKSGYPVVSGWCVGFSRLVRPSPVVVLGGWGPGWPFTPIHSST